MEFLPTLDSLRNYRCPEWFRDAKFGIYMHWGVYSVPASGIWTEWYGRHMFIEGMPDHQKHCLNWGHPSEFGYADFVPLWKAENFDPDALVALFKRVGARYFTPCAVHHDGFDLWNSKHNRWNAANMGPHKDLVGMFRDATLRQGLRWGVTTHLARNYSWLNVAHGSDQFGPYKGVPYDGDKPDRRDFYPEKHDDIQRGYNTAPLAWRQAWAARIKDLIDNYQPEHLYFDGFVPFPGEDNYQTGLDVLAHYYNANMRLHDGDLQAVMAVKGFGRFGPEYQGIATEDMERKISGGLRPEPWQTDTSVGPWAYTPGATYRPVGLIIQELVDIVSKNGNMLLNVPPRADGTLDAQTVYILEEIGDWLAVNGEAIYDTRPWQVYGESRQPRRPKNAPNDESESALTGMITPHDVRFTSKPNALYATVMSWQCPQVTIRSLGHAAGFDADRIANISLLGINGSLAWTQTEEALVIDAPNTKPCDYAYTYKVALK